MQRDNNNNNLISQLPIEILNVVLSQGDVIEAITAFMQTSKESAKRTTILLRNSMMLLAIMGKLEPIQLGEFIRAFFSSGSGNYQAIKTLAIEKKDQNAEICFALMIDDVNQIDWERLEAALKYVQGEKALPENVKKSLVKMKSIVKREQAIPAWFCYLNLSAADLSWLDIGNVDFSGANLSGANLSWPNLSGPSLSGANLSGANLSGANLSGANLCNRSLSWADLSGANLSGADFSGADFFMAKLSGANFRGADLRHAGLGGVTLSEVDFSGANLSGQRLSGYRPSKVRLKFSKHLSGANLSEASLNWVDLNGADLSGADLSGADIHISILREANLSGANFRGANLRYADLSEANLIGADLSGADLSGTDLSGANFSGANFSGANLEKVKIISGLRGIEPLKVTLDRLDTTIIDDSNNSSRYAVRSAVLKDLLMNVSDPKLLQQAYEHPYFSRHRDDASTRENINKGAKAIKGWFASSSSVSTSSSSFSRSAIETQSQKLLREKIEKLKNETKEAEKTLDDKGKGKMRK